MGDTRSESTHRRYVEASQKFDYFITGITGALCAYIAQNWKVPQKIVPLGPDVLQVVALLILFAAAIAGFKRLEWTVTMLGLNGQWLRVLETRGAMLKGVSESEGRMIFNAESGEILSPSDAMQEHTNLGVIAPRIQNQLEQARAKMGRWYKWRNRLLFCGFAVLVLSRLAALWQPK